MRAMSRTCLYSVLVLVIPALLVSCGPSKPSVDDAKTAIRDYYSSRERLPSGEIKVVRFGESGKGDFSAPGSQDAYWPVEFELPKETVFQAGPVTVEKPGSHGVAQIYRDKMGRWKVARIEH